jgi:opacity protein-like surface antigen
MKTFYSFTLTSLFAASIASADTSFYTSITPMYASLQGSSLTQSLNLPQGYSALPLNSAHFHKNTPGLAISVGFENDFNRAFLRTTAELSVFEPSNMSYSPLYTGSDAPPDTSARLSIQPYTLLAKEYFGVKLTQRMSIAVGGGVGEAFIRNTMSTNNVQPAFISSSLSKTNHHFAYAVGAEFDERISQRTRLLLGYEYLSLGKVESNNFLDVTNTATQYSLKKLAANVVYLGIGFG